MRRPRITIASLLGLVLLLAVALAALREATDLWDSGVFGLTLLTLLTAVLMVVYHKERKRAFWLGFGLFGWAYVIASLIPLIETRLPTTKGLTYLDSMVPGRSPAFTITFTTPAGPVTSSNTVQKLNLSNGVQTFAVNQSGVLQFWSVGKAMLQAGPYGTTENFVQIGHSLIALIMGFLGGCLSRWLYNKSRTELPTEPMDATARTKS